MSAASADMLRYSMKSAAESMVDAYGALLDDDVISFMYLLDIAQEYATFASEAFYAQVEGAHTELGNCRDRFEQFLGQLDGKRAKYDR